MESGDKSDSTDESDTEGEQENNQVNWDRVWPGTREKARRRSIGHAKGEGGKDKAKGAGRRGKEQAGTRQHAILKTEPEDNIQAKNVTKDKDSGTVQGGGAGLDDKVKGKGAGLGEEVQGRGAGQDGEEQAGTKPSANVKNEPKDSHDKSDTTKAKNKNEAGTNLGDSHQDGHRAGARTKAETDIGDSKAVTNLGDSHQDGTGPAS